MDSSVNFCRANFQITVPPNRIRKYNTQETLKNKIGSFKKMEKALTDTQIFMG